MNKMKYAFSLLLLTAITFISCDKDDGPVSGCTDTLSSNYNSEAEVDDGTCSYLYGGREKGQIDVGSEIDSNNEYDIYVDGEFIGRLTVYFPNGVFCGAPENPGRIFNAGTHVVRAVGNGATEIREGTVTLNPQECIVVRVETLQLISGGGGSGGGTGGGTGGGGTGGGGTGGGGTGGGGTGGGGTGGGGPTPGKIKFWTAQDFGCGNISVSVTGVGSGTISGFFDNGPGDCDNTGGGGNFSGIAPGTYSFSASCTDRTWNGSVSVSDGGCTLFQLL